jgi:hypothetical protein
MSPRKRSDVDLPERRKGLLSALERSLVELDVDGLDQAVVALARRYAQDLDHAEVVSVAASKWLREVQECLEPQSWERAKALLARVEATVVLASLGPKLLASLTELGMTPRAREAVAGGRRNRPVDDPLGDYRRDRAARAGSA